MEYLRNRPATIEEVASSYSNVLEDLKASVQSLVEGLRKKIKFPLTRVDPVDLSRELTESIRKAIEDVLRAHQGKPITDWRSDMVFAELQPLLCAGRLAGPSNAALNEQVKRIEQRFKERTPPGYEDQNKPVDKRYNDALIWFEMMALSKAEQRGIIFVSSDLKEDWWLKSANSNSVFAMRPELRSEFESETGQTCYLYRLHDFLRLSNEYWSAETSSQQIADAEALEEQQKRETDLRITAAQAAILTQREARRRNQSVSALTDAYLTSSPSYPSEMTSLIREIENLIAEGRVSTLPADDSDHYNSVLGGSPFASTTLSQDVLEALGPRETTRRRYE